MVSFFVKIKIFRFWPKTMDYNKAFWPKLRHIPKGWSSHKHSSGTSPLTPYIFLNHNEPRMIAVLAKFVQIDRVVQPIMF